MLFGPPPGYNSPSVNTQNVAAMNIPGRRGAPGQGYQQYHSSYSYPSSYLMPSSVDAPNPYYSQPIHPNVMMAKALGRT